MQPVSEKKFQISEINLLSPLKPYLKEKYPEFSDQINSLPDAENEWIHPPKVMLTRFKNPENEIKFHVFHRLGIDPEIEPGKFQQVTETINKMIIPSDTHTEQKPAEKNEVTIKNDCPKETIQSTPTPIPIVKPRTKFYGSDYVNHKLDKKDEKILWAIRCINEEDKITLVPERVHSAAFLRHYIQKKFNITIAIRTIEARVKWLKANRIVYGHKSKSKNRSYAFFQKHHIDKGRVLHVREKVYLGIKRGQRISKAKQEKKQSNMNSRIEASIGDAPKTRTYQDRRNFFLNTIAHLQTNSDNHSYRRFVNDRTYLSITDSYWMLTLGCDEATVKKLKKDCLVKDNIQMLQDRKTKGATLYRILGYSPFSYTDLRSKGFHLEFNTLSKENINALGQAALKNEVIKGFKPKDMGFERLKRDIKKQILPHIPKSKANFLLETKQFVEEKYERIATVKSIFKNIEKKKIKNKLSYAISCLKRMKSTNFNMMFEDWEETKTFMNEIESKSNTKKYIKSYIKELSNKIISQQKEEEQDDNIDEPDEHYQYETEYYDDESPESRWITTNQFFK